MNIPLLLWLVDLCAASRRLLGGIDRGERETCVLWHCSALTQVACCSHVTLFPCLWSRFAPAFNVFSHLHIGQYLSSFPGSHWGHRRYLLTLFSRFLVLCHLFAASEQYRAIYPSKWAWSSGLRPAMRAKALWNGLNGLLYLHLLCLTRPRIKWLPWRTFRKSSRSQSNFYIMDRTMWSYIWLCTWSASVYLPEHLWNNPLTSRQYPKTEASTRLFEEGILRQRGNASSLGLEEENVG